VIKHKTNIWNIIWHPPTQAAVDMSLIDL